MSESEPTVISYASGSQRERRHVSDILFPAIATAMFVGMLLLPISVMNGAKHVAEDFKIELSTTTQLAFDFYDLLIGIRANYWLWILPVTVPLALMPVRRETRYRLLLLAVLISGLVGLFSVYAAFHMWESIIGGMTGK